MNADDEYIELERFPHKDPLDELVAVLNAEGIDHRLSSTSPTFDFSSIGSEPTSDVIVSIPRSEYERARAALEQHYLRIPIPDDHHLRSADEDDLVEMLSHENEWSPFDVAHARRLARERGLDTERIRELAAERLRRLQEGKQASRLLVLAGFGLGILGACGFPFFSIASIGIAWSLVTMKKKSPEGVFPYFDRPSRKTGNVMLWFSLGALLVGILSYWLRSRF